MGVPGNKSLPKLGRERVHPNLMARKGWGTYSNIIISRPYKSFSIKLQTYSKPASVAAIMMYEFHSLTKKECKNARMVKIFMRPVGDNILLTVS